MRAHLLHPFNENEAESLLAAVAGCSLLRRIAVRALDESPLRAGTGSTYGALCDFVTSRFRQ